MTPTLVRTPRFAVVPFQKAHAADVARWMSRDPRELFFTSSSLPFPVTPKAFLGHRARATRGTHDFLSVLDRASGRHVGHFEIKNINPRHGTGTLSNVLLGDPDFRGRGLGKELCAAMADYAFRKRGLARLGLSVHTDNRVAVAAYLMGGFDWEGLVRDVLAFKGRRYSLYQMALLRRDWRARREAL